MVSFPNVKINLGLNILGKREDGFHNLQSIFYPVDWCDILEIIKADTNSLKLSGIPIPGEPNDNIVLKACELMQREFGAGPVSIWLHKTVPTGAGLGAGSSNGAFALKMMNELYQLNLKNEQLAGLAARLGSDCPFFIENKPCHVSGRGEIFQKTNLNLTGIWIKIIHTGLHISTKTAFSEINFKNKGIDLLSVDSKNIESYKNQFINDFEYQTFIKNPELESVKNELLQEGAFYASMTGSGSAIFGLFNTKPRLNETYPYEFIDQLK
jgi:4-diphosphocytidyl-2-C-methyl-D-erythritol kinase